MQTTKRHLALVALALLAAGCMSSATEPVDGTASSTALESPKSPSAFVRASSYSGDLCPEGTLSVVQGDGVHNEAWVGNNVLSIMFGTKRDSDVGAANAGIVELLAGTSTKSLAKSCKITIELDVPAGQQFAKLPITSRGAVNYGDDDARASMKTKYSFLGGSDEAESLESFSAIATGAGQGGTFRSDFAAGNAAPWSTCAPDSDPQRVRLVLEVTETMEGVGQLVLDSIDATFSYENGTDWRRCGSEKPFVAPPAKEGELCGGPRDLKCEESVQCQVTNAYSKFGQCVPAGVDTAEAKLLEPCAGVRATPCAAGLICHHASLDHANRGYQGACRPPTSDIGLGCGGYPAVTCPTGTVCPDADPNADALSARTCAGRDGDKGADCGNGLTPCKEGLECYAGACRQLNRGEGEPCGTFDACAEGLSCKDLTLVSLGTCAQ